MFYLGGRAVTFLTNLLYGLRLTDEPTCYKLFKSDVLKSIEIESKGFEFCPEVTAKIAKKGIKIFEVPISYNARGKEQGKKIKFKDGITAVWTLLKYRFKKYYNCCFNFLLSQQNKNIHRKQPAIHDNQTQYL